MLTDLRIALRSLLKVPGFTIAAVATLALGMGGTTIVFSLVDGLMVRPQPFGARSDRLVTLHSTHPTQARDWDDSEVSHADVLDVRERAQSIEAIEAWFSRTVALVGADESERVPGASVTPGLFALLGVSPASGRIFRADEGAEPGFEQVVVLGDALWRRRFGGDPTLLDRTIQINGRALTVVGIMPPGFRFPELQDLWLPYAPARPVDTRSSRRAGGRAAATGPERRRRPGRDVRDRAAAGGAVSGYEPRVGSARAADSGVLRHRCDAPRRDRDSRRLVLRARRRRHQRRGPAPDSRHGPPPRVDGPDRARRGPRAHRAAAPRREPAAVGRGRRRRPADGQRGASMRCWRRWPSRRRTGCGRIDARMLAFVSG